LFNVETRDVNELVVGWCCKALAAELAQTEAASDVLDEDEDTEEEDRAHTPRTSPPPARSATVGKSSLSVSGKGSGLHADDDEDVDDDVVEDDKVADDDDDKDADNEDDDDDDKKPAEVRTQHTNSTILLSHKPSKQTTESGR
jgi:hypothetical protein